MKRYQLHLRKEKTYWWDENTDGRCQFNAKNDEAARLFATTITQRMNRTYWRIGEPRNVSIVSIHRIVVDGYGDKFKQIPLWNCLKQLHGFSNIRAVLEAFYPREEKGRPFSMMPGFNDFRPIPRS